MTVLDDIILLDTGTCDHRFPLRRKAREAGGRVKVNVNAVLEIEGSAHLPNFLFLRILRSLFPNLASELLFGFLGPRKHVRVFLREFFILPAAFVVLSGKEQGNGEKEKTLSFRGETKLALLDLVCVKLGKLLPPEDVELALLVLE